MKNMNKLVKKKVVDKNGKVRTVWINPDYEKYATKEIKTGKVESAAMKPGMMVRVKTTATEAFRGMVGTLSKIAGGVAEIMDAKGRIHTTSVQNLEFAKSEEVCGEPLYKSMILNAVDPKLVFFVKSENKLVNKFKKEGYHKDTHKHKFNEKELMIGTYVELEHTKDKKVAAEIAKDHLMEDKDYYKNKFFKEDREKALKKIKGGK